MVISLPTIPTLSTSVTSTSAPLYSLIVTVKLPESVTILWTNTGLGNDTVVVVDPVFTTVPSVGTRSTKDSVGVREKLEWSNEV